MRFALLRQLACSVLVRTISRLGADGAASAGAMSQALFCTCCLSGLWAGAGVGPHTGAGRLFGPCCLVWGLRTGAVTGVRVEVGAGAGAGGAGGGRRRRCNSGHLPFPIKLVHNAVASPPIPLLDALCHSPVLLLDCHFAHSAPRCSVQGYQASTGNEARNL